MAAGIRGLQGCAASLWIDFIEPVHRVKDSVEQHPGVAFRRGLVQESTIRQVCRRAGIACR
jgi:hypothetical protein